MWAASACKTNVETTSRVTPGVLQHILSFTVNIAQHLDTSRNFASQNSCSWSLASLSPSSELGLDCFLEYVNVARSVGTRLSIHIPSIHPQDRLEQTLNSTASYFKYRATTLRSLSLPSYL
jgi:hypothetical protein